MEKIGEIREGVTPDYSPQRDTVLQDIIKEQDQRFIDLVNDTLGDDHFTKHAADKAKDSLKK